MAPIGGPGLFGDLRLAAPGRSSRSCWPLGDMPSLGTFTSMTVPLSLAPWSLFFPGFWLAWRWCREKGGTLPDGLQFAGVWALTVLVAFSVARVKRS